MDQYEGHADVTETIYESVTAPFFAYRNQNSPDTSRYDADSVLAAVDGKIDGVPGRGDSRDYGACRGRARDPALPGSRAALEFPRVGATIPAPSIDALAADAGNAQPGGRRKAMSREGLG